MSFGELQQRPRQGMIGLLHQRGTHWVSLEIKQVLTGGNPASKLMETIGRDGWKPLNRGNR